MQKFRFYLIIILLLFIFALRYKQAVALKTDSGQIQSHNGQTTILTGRILLPPEEKFNTQRLVVGDIALGKDHLSMFGKVLVKTRRYPGFKYADRISLKGRLMEPPEFEDFSYKEYLKIDGIYSLMNYPAIQNMHGLRCSKINFSNLNCVKLVSFNLIYQFRERVDNLLSSLLPEPHAALMMGIVFGIKKAYTDEVYDALRKAGVLHIIVASGFNVSVVVEGLLIFRGIFGSRVGAGLSLGGIFLYAVLAGLGPPIVRASILGAVAVVANLSGRQQHTLWWLILTAYIMLLVNPLWLKSLSFQLSFMAALGVLVVKPALEDKVGISKETYHLPSGIDNSGWRFLRKLPNPFRDDLLTTLSVMVLTTPLIWWNFGQISWPAFIVNTLVLWTVPLLMFLGVILIVVGFASTVAAQILIYPIWILLEYFLKVVFLFT